MTKRYSSRLERISLTNRFTSFYEIRNESKEKLLDFGIGQDNSLVNENVRNLVSKLSLERDFYRYAEGGEEVLVKAFRCFLKRQYGLNIPLENIAITMGIKEALNTLAFMLFDEGDILVTSTPGYNVFSRKVKLLGGLVHEVPLNSHNGYLMDMSEVDSKTLKDTKVVLLNYPNNPTGACATREYYERLLEIAKTCDFLIVNDGAYLDYSGKSKPLSLLSVDPSLNHTLELYSASKAFGMTGARVGMMVGPRDLIATYKLYRDQENSGQYIPLQYGYALALNTTDMFKVRYKYLQKGLKIVEVLSKHGLKVNEYRGGYYTMFKSPKFIDSKPIESANKCSAIFKSNFGIVFIPYPKLDSLRVSLTYDESILSELDKRLSGHVFSYE